MKVTMAWFGGSSYAAPGGKDVEHYPSLKIAKEVLWCRNDNADGRTPLVEGSEALIWRGHLADTTDVYPELRLYFGPHGGIRAESC